VGVAVVWLFTDAPSILSLSPLFDGGPVLSFPPVTAPRKRLYKPLRPFCIISPARPLFSGLEEEGGGDANSLNVVRDSDWLAVMCILSKAWESCSLSMAVLLENEAMDPRRDRSPRGKKVWPGATGESLLDIPIKCHSVDPSQGNRSYDGSWSSWGNRVRMVSRLLCLLCSAASKNGFVVGGPCHQLQYTAVITLLDSYRVLNLNYHLKIHKEV
jgi:hypothetical protein